MARPEGNFRRNLVRLKDAALAPGDHALRPVEIDGPHSDHPGERHAQFVIERSIPSAGKLTPPELQAISATSCGVLRDLGPTIQWVHSYVTDDKVYCIYNAPGEALVREHARQGGFPADAVSQVRQVISPITAEG